MSGTYVKLASTDYHIDELFSDLELEDNAIDIRKRFAYERNSRSKVLSIWAIQDDALEIDEILSNMNSQRYKYLSCRKTTSEERLAAMHHNDVKNIKAKYETLCDITLKEGAWDIEKSAHATLESILMKVKHENHPLFLAAEQGAGKLCSYKSKGSKVF